MGTIEVAFLLEIGFLRHTQASGAAQQDNAWMQSFLGCTWAMGAQPI